MKNKTYITQFKTMALGCLIGVFIFLIIKAPSITTYAQELSPECQKAKCQKADERIYRIANRLLSKSYSPEVLSKMGQYKWEYWIADTGSLWENGEVLLAGAYKDGVVVINRKWIGIPDDEMALLMGHELSHILLGHCTIPLKEAFSKKKNFESLFHFKYSKEQEYQADEWGMMLLIRAGYNPYAALNLYKRASEEESSFLKIFGPHPPVKYLMENPSMIERLERLRAYLEKEESKKRNVSSTLQAAPNYEEIVTRAYREILKREPNQEEKDRYIARLKAGMTEGHLRAELQYSEEYKRKFTELKEKVEELLPTAKKYSPPVINNIEPSSGAPGIKIKIYGNHFAPQGLTVPPYVRFEKPGSTPLNARVISFKDNEIEAIVPPWKGNVNVYVETIGPQKSSKHIFNYLPPEITSISPESGERGQVVRIIGKNFGTQQSLDLGHFLKFGNTIITPAKAISWDDKQVEVRAPKDFGTGIDQDIFLGLLGCFGGVGTSSELAKLVIDFNLPGCEDLLKNLVKRYQLSVKPGFLERKVQVTIETSVGKSNEKAFTFQIIAEIKHSPDPARPKIISNLKILETPPYKVGQIITAEFSIKNYGASSIVFDVLTVGGRLNGTCPQNRCPDFEFKPNVILPPNDSYTYRGTLKLEAPGNYHFFTAYRSKDGQWNTAIPTIPDVTNTKNIIVESPIVSCTDGADFVSHVAIPDNTPMQPNQGFTKTWRLKNTGSCVWGSGYSLVFVGGTQMGAPSSVSVPSIPQNGTADISVSMVAPSSPGSYQGNWQMRNAKGQTFGPQISVKINVTPPSTGCIASVSSDRWKGEYFNNKSLSGSPLMMRDDGTGSLNFDWGTSSPGSTCGIPSDNFSVRWTRSIYFEGGTYRFSVTADDGVRFYVDGTLKVDRWFDQPATTHTVDVPLSAGNHTLKMEYYESGGGAVAKLSWQKTTHPSVFPTISMSPLSGPVGTTFTEAGSGFTPNNTATLHGRRPDGSVWQITTVNINSTGAFSRTWTAQTPGNNFAWWAVDNATGKKSNEIIYNVASTQPPIDNPPNVTSFSASASEIGQGQSVTLSYSVSDDVGISYVRLMRADDTARVDFREIRRIPVSGRQNSGSISDTPPSPGTYRYGLHVVDTSGKWNCERNSQTNFSPGQYGPKQVVVGATVLTPTLTQAPPSGPVGTTFNQAGKGFTPNRTATIYGKNPDGSVVRIVTVNTDSAGSFTSAWTAQTPGNNLVRWAVDDATGKKSNEIVFNVTAPITPIDNPPNVTSFSASASEIGQGQSVTLSYSVSDDVGISYVRLMRADDTARVDFREIRRIPVSGKQYSGTISDTLTLPGTYRYGIHVVDTAGKWNCERNSQTNFSPGQYGPKQVVVGATVLTPTLTQAPPSGPVGTTFNQAGRGFTPNRTATIYGKNPDGGVVRIGSVNTDSTGSFTSAWTAQTPGNNLVRWAVDDATGKKSNEIVFNVTAPITPIDNPPNVTSFSASASEIGQGQSVTLSYSVSDDVGLSYVRLMRADDTARVDFREIRRVSVSGKQYSGTISDTLTSPGTYRYGIHVGDTAGKWNCERNSQSGFSPGVYGPRQVIVKSVAVIPPVSPTISMSPLSGPVGTTFTEAGSGFTPNNTATLHGRRPDGSVWQITTVNINSTGAFSRTWTAQTAGNNFAWWAVDNATGKKSNEIIYNVASTQPLVDNPPNVTSFSASASEIGQGQSVTLSYSVSDDVGISYVRLMRADDTARVDFREIRRIPVSGRQNSGSISDTPSSPGTYRYGLHVVDTSGKWNCERNSQSGFSPGVYGPRQVIVKSVAAPIVNPQIQVSTSPSGPWSTSASGQQNTIFYFRGSGFSPNATVRYHVRKPDGTEYPPGDYSGKVDGAGNFTHTYTSQCTTVVGTYTIWVIDKPTGKSSNTVSELITKNPNCK